MSEIMSHREAMLQEALAGIEADAYGVASVTDLAGGKLHEQVVALLPEAKSIVAFAMEIYPEVLDYCRPTRTMGEASPQDLLVSHQEYLNGRLNKAIYDLAKFSRRQGFKALPMPAAKYPTDQRYLTSVLSYKHAAQAAGLGTIGRHSLLVTPEFGPRVRLACVLTDVELKPTARLAGSLCDDCNACIAACPSGALREPLDGESYALDKFACSVYRAGSGGCVECMRLCPQGR
jgi:epoxyqueuosine reductase